jgi:catechol 2,3-dioxygenase-like lactoylglutathione lyase family enzyme
MNIQKEITAQLGLSKANHVGITVKDLDKAIAFYGALTGSHITPKDEIGGDRMAKVQGLEKTLIRYATVHLDNLNIDLLQYIEPQPEKANYSNEQISAMHLCFEVEDFQKAIQSMEDAGIQFNGNPITFQQEDGLKEGIGTSVAYFKDPDGTNLEIIFPVGPFKRMV